MIITERKWFYPLVYFGLILLSMLPPFTEIPYDPQNTQEVIVQIMMVSLNPYENWGWVFHVATLTLVILVILWPKKAGRIAAAYFGLNYLLIAALQTNGITEDYGFSIHTGALVTVGLLGIIWLWVAWKNQLQASFKQIPIWKWTLFPFALLVFWSPLSYNGTSVIPNFNPFLLLTSPDYGLAYCFLTPVFLFLLILFYPNVNGFAFRVTAFNGLIYGIYNLTHWFDPETAWLGVMHLPLLVIPMVALLLPRFSTSCAQADQQVGS